MLVSLSVIFKPAGLPFVCPENKSLCCSFHSNIFYPFCQKMGKANWPTLSFYFSFVFCPTASAKNNEMDFSSARRLNIICLGLQLKLNYQLTCGLHLGWWRGTPLPPPPQSLSWRVGTNWTPILNWSRQVNSTAGLPRQVTGWLWSCLLLTVQYYSDYWTVKTIIVYKIPPLSLIKLTNSSVIFTM